MAAATGEPGPAEPTDTMPGVTAVDPRTAGPRATGGRQASVGAPAGADPHGAGRQHGPGEGHRVSIEGGRVRYAGSFNER